MLILIFYSDIQENREISNIVLFILGRMETHLHTRKTKMLESFQPSFYQTKEISICLSIYLIFIAIVLLES